ncbi:MAG: pyridoxamine 5'-phosphate oxidase family protein [Solirubrobacteraceae bacterium]
MDDEERERRREFVRQHRTAVFGYPRQDAGPSMSVVYYVVEDKNQLLVSTMQARAKAKAVSRNPEVSLCILDEQWPLTYLQVYCRATLDPDIDAAVDLMMRISTVMAGEEMPDSARPDVEEMVRREQRVVLRLAPYATFQTPPRHVHKADDLKGLTHWTSSSLPW